MKKISKNSLKDSHHITELKLCSVRLVDNSEFPWIMLIPKRKKISEIFQLNKKDQNLLIQEIVYSSKIMKKTFNAFNLNVEKIGNIILQLHIHIIARSKKDSTWPLSVWVVKEKSYTKKLLLENILKLKRLL